MRGIRAEGATGVYNALYLTLKDPRFRRKADELSRQAVVVLSDGEDTSSLVSDEQVLQLAKKENVTVFAISLRQPRPSTLDTEAPDRAAFFLTALARDTGGRSYFPNGLAQIDGVYDKIADELRTQYALGYVSSNPSRDGKWRRIAISTAQGNLMLRHKQGYYAGALRALRSAVGAAKSGGRPDAAEQLPAGLEPAAPAYGSRKSFRISSLAGRGRSGSSVLQAHVFVLEGQALDAARGLADPVRDLRPARSPPAGGSRRRRGRRPWAATRRAAGPTPPCRGTALRGSKGRSA